MSKITDSMIPEDFGKSFDMEVFNSYKKSHSEYEQASIIMMVLYFVGMACLILLGGFVGIGLFFVLAFIGLGICLPKFSKVKKYRKQLGITGNDLVKAVAAAKKRIKHNVS